MGGIRSVEIEWDVPHAAPAVIGEQPGSEQRPNEQAHSEQEAAFVPSQRLRDGDAEVTLELRQTEDGQLAMLAYSSLELLVDGCGQAQPWVAVPTDRVDGLASQGGAETVLWDVGLTPEQRHPAS